MGRSNEYDRRNTDPRVQLSVHQPHSPELYPMAFALKESVSSCLKGASVHHPIAAAELMIGLLMKDLEHMRLPDVHQWELDVHDRNAVHLRAVGIAFEAFVASVLSYKIAGALGMECQTNRSVIAYNVAHVVSSKFADVTAPRNAGILVAKEDGKDEPILIGLPDFILTRNRIPRVIVEATTRSATHNEERNGILTSQRYFSKKIRNFFHLCNDAHFCGSNALSQAHSLLFIVSYEATSPVYKSVDVLLEGCWNDIRREYERMKGFYVPHDATCNLIGIPLRKEFNIVVRLVEETIIDNHDASTHFK